MIDDEGGKRQSKELFVTMGSLRLQQTKKALTIVKALISIVGAAGFEPTTFPILIGTRCHKKSL